MDLSVVTVLGAGLATFLTPCVLPVIPLYLATLSGGNLSNLSSKQRTSLILRALGFSMGFIAVFTLLGLTASSLGAALSTHKALVSAVGAVLVAMFALKFLGLVQIPLLDRVAKFDDSRLSHKVSLGSAVLLGAAFAAGWSPCVGPVLGSVLTFTAARTSSPWEGAAWLGLYGLGFALPLLVLAAFAQAGAKLLYRMTPALPVFEKLVGGLLVIVAGSMIVDATTVPPPTAAQAAKDSTISAPSMFPEEKVARMVELYTPQCPICQRMKPIVDRVASVCDNHGVRVEAIDVSRAHNKSIVAQHRVVGVPTFLFFDENGQEVARLVGEQSEATLYQALSALRGQECPGLALIDKVRDKKPEETLGKLRFPEPNKEVVTCRSTNTSANNAPKSSKSSGEPRTPILFDARAAEETRESCSADLL